MNHLSTNFSPSFSLVRIIPHFISLLRLGFCWPMIVTLKEKDYLMLLLWLALFIILDNLDGAIARLLKLKSLFGKFLDSFVDKTSFLILLLVAFYYNQLPLFLLIIILGVNLVQIAITWWGIVYQKRRELPVTYFQGLVVGVLLLTLFLSDPYSYLAYLLVIALTFNHIYFYGKKIFPLQVIELKNKISAKGKRLKLLLTIIPVIKIITGYIFTKWGERNRVVQINRVFTIGNLVTIGRITLIPIILYYYWFQKTFIWALLLIVFIVADFLDGALARNFNQVSRVGKILDAVTDKALFIAFLIVWLLQEQMPIWLFSFIVVRVLLILIMAGLILFTKKGPLPIAYFSFLSIISLLFFLFWQTPFWLTVTVLCNWQLVVNYWHQGILILINKKRVV